MKLGIGGDRADFITPHIPYKTPIKPDRYWVFGICENI